ncbi:MAG: DUF3048 domain-containing protein [Ilumatobacter sp.]|nr:DUF3048 domain-containing protein [Ilumatobacter sp.]
MNAPLSRRPGLRLAGIAALAMVLGATGLTVTEPPRAAASPIAPGTVLRVSVPGAIGGKTVIGNVAVDGVTEPGFVTAYGCDDGLPFSPDGKVGRADLNYDGRLSPVWSNRLIVEADDDGEVCFYTFAQAELIVDVSAVSFDTGITSFSNRRTDTRWGGGPVVHGGVLRVSVPEAVGGKTVIGNLAVDRATEPGFVTAYGCDRGLPFHTDGEVRRADLNYDGGVSGTWSNRLVVQADADGDVCFYTWASVEMIVDINGAFDTGITSFANRRTDTRWGETPIRRGGVLRVSVPEAARGKTVFGNLAVDRATEPGFVTAFGCDDGLPVNAAGKVDRSDLNYDGLIAPVWSNRLVVQADDDGDICLYTLASVDMIVDINGVAGRAAIQAFPNRRTDTRDGSQPPTHDLPVDAHGVPQWPIYETLPPFDGVAALTGEPAPAAITNRPILAVKVDNYRRARPPLGLESADAVIETNVEGITRFIALFHTELPPQLGPIRSARTADLDLLAAMNRPIFGYSGANPGVTAWVESAATSGVLVDFSAQRRPCYSRDPARPGPHNLLLDPACVALADEAAGPARPLWRTDAAWVVPLAVTATPDTSFSVPMDGVNVAWVWDRTTATYLRQQDRAPHVAASGVQIAAHNVVVISSTHVPSPVDARSPNAITVGSGDAVVHRDGLAIPATWTRATPYDEFTFVTATGVDIPLDTGTTFIELTRDR